MRNGTGWVAAACAVTMAVAGCGGSGDADDASAGTGGAGQERTIGYSNPMGADHSLKSIGYGMEQAIEALDLPWKVKETDAKLSPDKQVADIDSLIARKVDAITSWTLNSGGLQATYMRAQAAGIPIIGYNSESDVITTNVKSETDSTCVVADEQAAFIAERVPKARVLMIEGPPVPSITFTTECFRKAAAAAGLRVVGKATDAEASESSANKVATTLLTKNAGKVDAIWTFADHPGAGVSAAVDAAGLDIWTEKEPRGLILVSRDGAQVALENVERGLLTASWDGNFPQLGAAAIELLKRHFVDGVPLEELPKDVVIKATRYDITNVGEYEPVLERPVRVGLEQ